MQAVVPPPPHKISLTSTAKLVNCTQNLFSHPSAPSEARPIEIPKTSHVQMHVIYALLSSVLPTIADAIALTVCLSLPHYGGDPPFSFI